MLFLLEGIDVCFLLLYVIDLIVIIIIYILGFLWRRFWYHEMAKTGSFLLLITCFTYNQMKVISLLENNRMAS